jgi:hypothetical protein
MIVAISVIVGGVWRVMLGGWLNLPRSALMAGGAILASLIIWLANGSYYAMVAGAALSILYFAIGNSAVLGQRGSIFDYIKIFIAPAFVSNLILWLCGYQTIIAVAGIIAAAGYYLFWQPFVVGAPPWNHKAEALMGASWFGFLAFNLGALSWII